MRVLKYRNLLNVVLMLTTLSMFGACAQGRKSLSRGASKDRLSQTVLLDRVYDDGKIYPHYGIFQLQLNIDKNFAYLDVLELGSGWSFSNPLQTYRVYARREGEAKPFLLAYGLNAAPGETIELDVYQGHKVFEYVEWFVEFDYYPNGGLASKNATHPELTIVQDTIMWPELDEYLAKQRR